MNSEAIIYKGLVTERSVAQQKQGKYTFVVDRNTNKIEIRKAVEDLFKVQVQEVRTLTMKGKARFIRRKNKSGQSLIQARPWKKAIVTLQAGQSIELLKA